MNILQKIEQQWIADKKIPDFQAGDTVKVFVKVVEGERERTQTFEGIVIGRRNSSSRSTFRVRKISYGEGVERVFPLYSPNISLEVVRKGDTRRAKLYYLRERTGKSARIVERIETKAKVSKGVKEAAE